ncbi:hypothetical protein C2S51_024919 [Perilla frutescens var. frutescens]|nr:hypothetical protein C2S51_024919 [Perilla frutescens var. frutescens]
MTKVVGKSQNGHKGQQEAGESLLEGTMVPMILRWATTSQRKALSRAWQKSPTIPAKAEGELQKEQCTLAAEGKRSRGGQVDASRRMLGSTRKVAMSAQLGHDNVGVGFILQFNIRSSSNINALGISEVQEHIAAGDSNIPRTSHEVIDMLACRLAHWDDMTADEVEMKFMNKLYSSTALESQHICDEGYQIAYTRNEVNTNRILANDELYIPPSDHPGMFLTIDLFDGKNFHNWCRAVKRGLLSMNKLKIIDGSLNVPRTDSINYMQWLKVDYLVFNWISNSMTKEIARGFQNLDTSKQLWGELHKHFGKKNGPRLYKLHREIATYTQHTQTVMVYFNNLTSLWDDLALLKNSRMCTCAAYEDMKADLKEEHLMRFLMGLSDLFETIRQQILILNPLPTVSQAYSMILQVNDQINVSNQLTEGADHGALYINQKGGYREDAMKRRLSKEEKSKLRCEHCGGSEHVKSECFDIIGVPDWYKKYKTNKGKGRAHCAMQKDEDYKEETEMKRKRNVGDLPEEALHGVSKLIQAELAKHLHHYFHKGLKGEELGGDGGQNLVNMAELDLGNTPIEFKGNYAFGAFSAITKQEWIVDSGTSKHM